MVHKHKHDPQTKNLHVLILFSFQTCVCLFLFASMFSSHLSDVTLSLFLSSSVLFILEFYLILFQTFLKFLFVLIQIFLKDAGLLQEDQWSCKRSPEICCIYQ